MNRILLFMLSFSSMLANAQTPRNWTDSQLLKPAVLAEAIRAGNNSPVVISVGPGALIPGSVSIGMTRDQENLDKLKAYLGPLPRTSSIVIYCGCCPFEHCPNVRPAIDLLQKMKFTNYSLLDLPHNLKTDWMDKGYPVVKDSAGH